MLPARLDNDRYPGIRGRGVDDVIRQAFVEVFADGDAAAEATVKTLPMARRFNLELYPTFDTMSFRAPK
jgi:hypothetical protein